MLRVDELIAQGEGDPGKSQREDPKPGSKLIDSIEARFRKKDVEEAAVEETDE